MTNLCLSHERTDNYRCHWGKKKINIMHLSYGTSIWTVCDGSNWGKSCLISNTLTGAIVSGEIFCSHTTSRVF